MQKHFSRLVGIGVIMIVVLAASLLVWALSIAERPVGMWNPIEVHIGRLWTTFYSSELPDLSILVFSVAAAVILVLLVVLGERLVTWRYRRTPIEKSSRPLAPKAVMARTRGVYAGPVTVTVLIPAHNEEASLPYTLKALEEQSFAPSRIIVVADNCTDRTVQVAGEHGDANAAQKPGISIPRRPCSSCIATGRSASSMPGLK